MTAPRLSLDVLARAPSPRTGCYACEHLSKETESWELPDVYWYECQARPGNSNLRQFPFRTTTCSERSS